MGAIWPPFYLAASRQGRCGTAAVLPLAGRIVELEETLRTGWMRLQFASIAAVVKVEAWRLGIVINLIPGGVKNVSGFRFGDFGAHGDAVQQVPDFVELGLR